MNKIFRIRNLIYDSNSKFNKRTGSGPNKLAKVGKFSKKTIRAHVRLIGTPEDPRWLSLKSSLTGSRLHLPAAQSVNMESVPPKSVVIPGATWVPERQGDPSASQNYYTFGISET